MAAPARKTRYRVEGMDCAACAAKIETVAKRVSGVTDVMVSATAGTMVIDHEPDADLAEMARKISSLGYGLSPETPGRPSKSVTATLIGKEASAHHDHASHGHAGHNHSGHGHLDHSDLHHERDQRAAAKTEAAPELGVHGHDHTTGDGSWWQTAKARLTFACGAALGAAFILAQLYPATEPWIFIAAMTVGLLPIARRAVTAAVNGMPFTIETLMTVAAIGAVVIDASEEAASGCLLVPRGRAA